MSCARLLAEKKKKKRRRTSQIDGETLLLNEEGTSLRWD